MANQLERVALLETVPLFDTLKKYQLKQMAKAARTVRLARHSVVVREGDPADAAFLIVDGRAEVRTGFELINTLKVGDVFGELALLTGGSRTATVSMTREGELLRIERDAFLEVLHASPDLAVEVAAQLARRLRAANERLHQATRPI